MNDFFTALELELRAAGERAPRRTVGVGHALGLIAATALVVIAVLFTMSVRGGGDRESGEAAGAAKPDPVGTVIPRKGSPYETRALVVANGRAPVTGPWQLEVSRTRGERDTSGALMWPAGYCIWIRLVDPPEGRPGPRNGACGSPRSLGFRGTPGFSRHQGGGATRAKPLPKAELVWGRVPDRAAKVVITAPDGLRVEARPKDGPRSFPGRFYGIQVETGHPKARINWLDARGRPGSRGMKLLPPITKRP